ncbi:MAG TPA: GTPase HflX [Bacillota bacterium]|nr:GTPase HflX [Bacillota bacterium]
MSETAGGNVKQVITQNRQRIHPSLYLGEGKLTETKRDVERLAIDLVIANDELSPSQLRNLNDRLGVRIIDRSQLILDIFAKRAKTKEGKLQVELAQLEYMLPRLRGYGSELSRLGGGIGTRGPGETKLETDQRHIRNRIFEIKRRLKNVVQQRDQYRKRRRANKKFQIAIVGYTNAGKSTLFNQLTKSESLAENQLFATLDPLTRMIQLPSGLQTLLTDTVGFIQDLPTTLIAAFRSTLEEVSEADFILHVVDGSHPDWEQHQKTVAELLEELDAHTIPMLTVYNKKDLIPHDFIGLTYPNVLISALDQADIDKLLAKLENVLIDEWDHYIIKLNPDEGKIMQQLTQETIIVDQYFDTADNQYVVSGYIRKEHPLKGRLNK